MEWQVKPLARVSAVTGVTLVPGDRVISFLFRDDEGQLVRHDVLEAEEADYRVPEQLLARWQRQVKAAGEEEREARKQMLESAEDVFIALFDATERGDDESATGDDRAALKQLLALMLERKRILRALDRRGGDAIRYLHVASKQEFVVSATDLLPEQAARLQDDLQQFVL